MVCMENKKKHRLHNRKGFTLAETLLAVLILLMVSQIVATGIPVAKNAYEKVVLTSNAEVLLSTAATVLRNELGTAREIKVSDTQTEVTYLNADRANMAKIGMEDGSVKIHRYYPVDGIGIDSGADPLVSRERATEKLYVTFEKVKYDEDNKVVTFEKVSVCRESGSTGLAVRESLSINVM